MPRIQLAAVECEPLLADRRGLESLDDRWIWSRGQEADQVALGIGGDALERIALHHLGQLVARPHDDLDVEAELLGDQPLYACTQPCGCGVARQDDIPALHVRLHLAEAGRRQGVAQCRHRDPVAGAEVDPAQQDDLDQNSAS